MVHDAGIATVILLGEAMMKKFCVTTSNNFPANVVADKCEVMPNGALVFFEEVEVEDQFVGPKYRLICSYAPGVWSVVVTDE